MVVTMGHSNTGEKPTVVILYTLTTLIAMQGHQTKTNKNISINSMYILK